MDGCQKKYMNKNSRSDNLQVDIPSYIFSRYCNSLLLHCKNNFVSRNLSENTFSYYSNFVWCVWSMIASEQKYSYTKISNTKYLQMKWYRIIGTKRSRTRQPLPLTIPCGQLIWPGGWAMYVATCTCILFSYRCYMNSKWLSTRLQSLNLKSLQLYMSYTGSHPY